ncbi:isochorismatase [Colletotrichum truncatum]|uniref:Isochorismatase n=1 Tax=Colletotrichum truncatum TaxID=5467 RepID=A0ACC3Z360_COLTU|nr:isochorismatase [Colletotrichum truncatum]KAF6793172.1 isochorismatase [Colletotrichum truncatum]
MQLSKLLATASVLSATAFAYKYERLNRNDSMIFIVDHQVGLFSLVRDLEPTYFKANIMAHAVLAKAFDLPVVMSTSIEHGPNGPIPGEILDMFPEAPIIKRPGEVNAWDNPDVRDAIIATNRSQIIIGGIMTDVCTAFAALSLREAGYGVWANIEASGTVNEMVRDASNDRMKDAGVQLVSLSAIWGELMRDWRTPPTGINTFAFMDEYVPSIGMLSRGHRAAVENGTLVPGEDTLPSSPR